MERTRRAERQDPPRYSSDLASHSANAASISRESGNGGRDRLAASLLNEPTWMVSDRCVVVQSTGR